MGNTVPGIPRNTTLNNEMYPLYYRSAIWVNLRLLRRALGLGSDWEKGQWAPANQDPRSLPDTADAPNPRGKEKVNRVWTGRHVH
ncbi:hypothetical protein XELAEV_18024001mg [Xenopus laevis]|uniref:Uncharacterized protein n=1 Tax=Xenopus laevis TaxID=8355 RepID=A0A974HPM3_XENLA|nr:hypothetical protein XELAEV_18024001mg [Xenopus laevis]